MQLNGLRLVQILFFIIIYRPVLIQYGLCDQVRVDCGKEFYLTLFIQQSLSGYRKNTLRACYKQTPSTKVNTHTDNNVSLIKVFNSEHSGCVGLGAKCTKGHSQNIFSFNQMCTFAVYIN